MGLDFMSDWMPVRLLQLKLQPRATGLACDRDNHTVLITHICIVADFAASQISELKKLTLAED
ncbi:hypothetical protein [Oscillatoria sp. HE19RPO]|uniref:hypothetical protein n=1 Tax=Oscillatoria sp. HE19RPO TaxID=2954806 RepID=UPI0020C3C9B8|nr:hypothetical protein [Oscillatoria sp. HE19RPO]